MKEIKEILVRSKEQQALDDLKALANAKENEEVYIEYGLNTKAKILLDYIINLQEENERLNNGIKELDNMFYEAFRISQNGYYSISEWELKDFTDKLKELKDNK